MHGQLKLEFFALLEKSFDRPAESLSTFQRFISLIYFLIHQARMPP